MARPVVHFEVIGRNPDQLRRYYGSHPDSSARVLDGQWVGSQSPSGSVV